MSGRHGVPPLGSAAREATAAPWHGRHRAEDLGGSGWAYRFSDEDWRCFSCGAEVDHYLGCPDDPRPDYEAEAKARAERIADERWSDPEDDNHDEVPDGE